MSIIIIKQSIVSHRAFHFTPSNNIPAGKKIKFFTNCMGLRGKEKKRQKTAENPAITAVRLPPEPCKSSTPRLEIQNKKEQAYTRNQRPPSPAQAPSQSHNSTTCSTSLTLHSSFSQRPPRMIHNSMSGRARPSGIQFFRRTAHSASRLLWHATE